MRTPQPRDRRKAALGGLGFRLGLEAVQEIDGLLRVRSCLHDAALVVFQDFEPRRDVRGVVVADLRRQLQVGAQER